MISAPPFSSVQLNAVSNMIQNRWNVLLAKNDTVGSLSGNERTVGPSAAKDSPAVRRAWFDRKNISWPVRCIFSPSLLSFVIAAA
jgi:hypothetical protein